MYLIKISTGVVIDFHGLRQAGILLNQQQPRINLLFQTVQLSHRTPQQQLPPTCLVLAVAAGLLIFAL